MVFFGLGEWGLYFWHLSISLLLLRLAVFLRCHGLGAARRVQHSVAAAGDLVHPHDVHDVQADAGADPGHAAAPGHQVVGLGAVDSVHAAVVDRHDGDADQEEDHRHGDTVGHVGPRGLWVAEHLEEPAET